MNFLVSLYWWAWQIKGLSVQIFNHTEFFFNDGDDDDNDDDDESSLVSELFLTLPQSSGMPYHKQSGKQIPLRRSADV